MITATTQRSLEAVAADALWAAPTEDDLQAAWGDHCTEFPDESLERARLLKLFKRPARIAAVCRARRADAEGLAMSRALIVVNGDSSRRKAVHWASRAPLGTRIEFKAPRRSLDQNALMWARLTQIAQGVDWYGQKLSAEDWKDVFTASLRHARVVPGLDPGTFVPLGMRTSDMSKEEMGTLLDLIDAFAAEHGVTFAETEAA